MTASHRFSRPAAAALALVAVLALLLTSCSGGTTKSQAGVSQLAVENGAVKEIGVADFTTAVKDSSLPVLVDFYATWCPPCKASAPFIESLAETYEGKLLIVRVDTDKAQALASQYGIQSIPTFFLIDDGTIQGKLVGYASSMDQDFYDLIDAHVG